MSDFRHPLPGGGSAVRTGTGTAYSFEIADPHGAAVGAPIFQAAAHA
ncbi:hypothetical protein ABZ379_23425 [Streptomyces canus]